MKVAVQNIVINNSSKDKLVTKRDYDKWIDDFDKSFFFEKLHNEVSVTEMLSGNK